MFTLSVKATETRHASELLSVTEHAELSQERAILALRTELTASADKERVELTTQLRNVERENSAELRRLYETIDQLRQKIPPNID